MASSGPNGSRRKWQSIRSRLLKPRKFRRPKTRSYGGGRRRSSPTSQAECITADSEVEPFSRASGCSVNNLLPATMATSADTLSLEKSSPSEDWTVVLPCKGKKNRTTNKFVIPKREKEVQLWAPIDLETDPNRESKLMQNMQTCIQKLANSEFYCAFLRQIQNPDTLDKFLRVLGTEKKMQIVIYGIGSIESFESPRLQLSLAILMKRAFDWIGEIEVVDPIISSTESKVLTSLGCKVLSINEQGRRQALKPTLFFMPHCEVELYNNLLEANWEVDKLNRLIILGNSLGAYEQQVLFWKSSAVAHARKHVLAVRSFTQESEINVIPDDYFHAFHGSSWHFFNPIMGADLTLIDQL